MTDSVKSCVVNGLEYRWHVTTNVIKVGPNWKTFCACDTKKHAEQMWEDLVNRAQSSTALEPASAPALVAIASHLKEDFQQYDMAERDAAIRALRIGLRLIQAKGLLPHGQFEAWRDATVTTARETQCLRFMAIAKKALAEGNLSDGTVKALCEGGTEKEEKKAQQLLLDFIGGRSQAELFADYGIMLREPKNTGGANQLNAWLREHHPDLVGTRFEKLPASVKKKWEQHLRQLEREKYGDAGKDVYRATEWWEHTLNQLHLERTADKRFLRVDLPVLKRISASLLDLKRTIDDTIAKG